MSSCFVTYAVLAVFFCSPSQVPDGFGFVYKPVFLLKKTQQMQIFGFLTKEESIKLPFSVFAVSASVSLICSVEEGVMQMFGFPNKGGKCQIAYFSICCLSISESHLFGERSCVMKNRDRARVELSKFLIQVCTQGVGQDFSETKTLLLNALNMLHKLIFWSYSPAFCFTMLKFENRHL